jgi:hypothetical protein
VNNLSDHELFIGELQAGRWVALTKVAPYLCFEADSKEALYIKCREAVAFCRRAFERHQERERIENIIPFHVREIILAKDLVDA